VLARATRSLLVTLLAARLVDEWVSFLPAGALESIRADLGLTYTEAGAVLAAIYVGGLLGTFISVAADHVDRRWLSAGGALVYALSMAGFAVGASFPVLVAAAVLLALGSDAMVSGTEVALVDVVRAQTDEDGTSGRLATVLARQGFGAYVGDLLGPLTLVAVVAAGWSWRLAFVVGAVVSAVYAAVLASQPFPATQANGDDDEAPGAAVWRLLRDRRLLALGLLTLGLALADEELTAFLVAYLQVDLDFSAGAANAMVLAEVVGGLVATAGLAVRRTTTDGVAIPGAAMAGGIVLMVVVPRWPVIALGAFVFGAGLAISWTRLQARVLSHSVGRAGTATAVVSLVEIPAVAGPIVAGALADAAGLRATLAAYAVVAVVFALGSALMSSPRRPRGAKPVS
jgi:DHA1 family multidrug resistance protein-like MFS transporter